MENKQKTKSALQKKSRCPKCKVVYDNPPALSREDNLTEICPRCGMKEAIMAMLSYTDGANTRMEVYK